MDTELNERIAELEAEVARLRAAAPVSASPQQAAPSDSLYDLNADKEFEEDFARLAEGIPNRKTRKLVIKAVKQAIAAHGAAERERGRRDALAASHQATAGAEGAWISVDERLPEADGDVLIAFWPYDNHENARVVTQAWYTDGSFLTWENGDEHHPPSHWMPMPALPAAPSTSQPAKEA